ncbi:MAG: hypothetical protein HYU64_10320 [Armatimonadetes bacterium]|nr:hypothetical protein [Armatimonadota bacterium]
MGAVSYPDPLVIQFFGENLIPLRVPADAKPISVDFNVHWTPTLIILDQEGVEHHRVLGFFAPEQLIPHLLLGTAKVDFNTEHFPQALEKLERLLMEHYGSDAVPEAIYLKGVCRYKSTHDARPLKEAYERLKAEHPSSEWTRRADPYRLL